MDPNEQYTYRAPHKLLTKKHIAVAIVILAALLALIVLLAMRSYGWLEVTAPTTLPKGTSVVIEVKGDNIATQTVSMVAGGSKRIRLKTGRVQVSGKTDTVKAIDIITIKGFSTTKLVTPMGEDRAVQQLASHVASCAAFAGGAVYSYACGGNDIITQHRPSPAYLSINTKLFNGQTFSYAESYGNGLIAMPAGDGGQLSYVDLNGGTMQPLPLSETIKSQVANSQPLIITSNKAGDRRYGLLLMAANKLYLFSDITDTDPKVVSPQAAVSLNDSGRAAWASFFDDNLLLYVGVAPPIEHDGGEGGGEGTITPDPDAPSKPQTNPDDLAGYIFEYDHAGTISKTINLPKGFKADRIYKLANDFYLGSTPSTTNFYHLVDNKLQFVYSLPEVGSYVTQDGKAYLEADGSLYVFIPGADGNFSLRSAFAAPGVTVSAIFAGQNGIIFTGFTGQDKQQTLNAYQLLPTKLGANEPQHIEPAYSGFDEFITHGMTTDQVDNIKYAIGLYAHSLNKIPKLVALSAINVHSRSKSNPTSYADFTVVIDQDTLNAHVTYDGFTLVHLTLSTTAGAQVYDSGDVDYQNTTF